SACVACASQLLTDCITSSILMSPCAATAAHHLRPTTKSGARHCNRSRLRPAVAATRQEHTLAVARVPVTEATQRALAFYVDIKAIVRNIAPWWVYAEHGQERYCLGRNACCYNRAVISTARTDRSCALFCTANNELNCSGFARRNKLTRSCINCAPLRTSCRKICTIERHIVVFD